MYILLELHMCTLKKEAEKRSLSSRNKHLIFDLHVSSIGSRFGSNEQLEAKAQLGVFDNNNNAPGKAYVCVLCLTM